MSRLAAAFLFVLSALPSLAQAPCPPWANDGSTASKNWQYDIKLADATHQLLHVQMHGEPTSPDLKVQLPVWNATYQVRDFAEHINWLRATDAAGKPVTVRKIDKTTWSVPNAASVEYEIAAIDSGPFGAEFTQAHAFLNLAQVLIYPVGGNRGSVWVRLDGLPQGWRVATPLNPASGANTYCATNYDALVDSPIEAGAFRDLAFDAGGATYHVIVDADPDDYDGNDLREMLRKIVTAEVDWMQDRPYDRYTFFYHFPKEFGRGGMEHAYSTAIEASVTRLHEGPLAIAGVSAHEFFHLWNVKRIRPQSLEPIDYAKENYTRALWFSEGLTDTVSEFMLVRSGIADEPIFLDRLADAIKLVESSPAHLTQSAEESSLDAWLEKYPYYRAAERSVSYYKSGHVIGVLLDLEMRRVTDGRKCLRDLFQWMNLHYAKQGKFYPDSDGVREAAEAVTGAKFGDFFRKYVSGTEPLPKDIFQSVGLKLDRREVVTADAGFTAASNYGPTPVVIAITPGSPADLAKLHAGDTILSVNGAEVPPDVVQQIASMLPGTEIRLKVSSRNRTREVHYTLDTKKDILYSFAELPDATAAQRARRAAWIRGDAESTTK